MINSFKFWIMVCNIHWHITNKAHLFTVTINNVCGPFNCSQFQWILEFTGDFRDHENFCRTKIIRKGNFIPKLWRLYQWMEVDASRGPKIDFNSRSQSIPWISVPVPIGPREMNSRDRRSPGRDIWTCLFPVSPVPTSIPDCISNSKLIKLSHAQESLY